MEKGGMKPHNKAHKEEEEEVDEDFMERAIAMLDTTVGALLVMNLSGQPMFPKKKKKKIMMMMIDDMQEGIHGFQASSARGSCYAMEGPYDKVKSVIDMNEILEESAVFPSSNGSQEHIMKIGPSNKGKSKIDASGCTELRFTIKRGAEGKALAIQAPEDLDLKREKKEEVRQAQQRPKLPLPLSGGSSTSCAAGVHGNRCQKLLSTVESTHDGPPQLDPPPIEASGDLDNGHKKPSSKCNSKAIAMEKSKVDVKEKSTVQEGKGKKKTRLENLKEEHGNLSSENIHLKKELEELKTTMNELNTKNASMKSELELYEPQPPRTNTAEISASSPLPLALPSNPSSRAITPASPVRPIPALDAPGVVFRVPNLNLPSDELQ